MNNSTIAVLDGLARQGDDPLDQVALLGVALDALQHHDVATARVVEAIAELVDQHPVAGVQRVEHRRAFDGELLQHIGADQQGRN